VWHRLTWALGLLLLLPVCSSDTDRTPNDTGSGGQGTGAAGGSGGVAPGPSADCGSVRLTSYTAGPQGWCEYDRTLAVLPISVRDGLTLAIAEPYNGSSYGGEPGESCGECWEIDTITDTATVMVHDLCPIAGNPLCAGGHFHFDLSTESGTALQGGGLDEGQARRVPCPVAGNVFAQINDRNEWGYLRLAFVNHRIPIRSAEYRAASGGAWLPVQRSGGAWHVLDDTTTFAAAGPGGVFRLTSAQGETLETPNVLGYDVAMGSVFDLGAQLTDQAPPTGGACAFEPPALVYGDGYGGIPEVRWQSNPWGEAADSEVTDGCYGGAGSCIRFDGLGQYSGFHLYYRQAFPTATFATLSLRLRALAGGGDFVVAPSLEGTRCTETTTTVGADWSEVTIDLATACAGLVTINAVTVDNPGAPAVLLVDEVRFAK
jgi:expansin (peptidoglycan-binding protein)